ncbi:MAG: hypothetical protein DRO12_06410 [Thermoprotei archaeon]|nr:MAG: hypothetical protein DRO12_06410 [Thermoprotei archaeon]
MSTEPEILRENILKEFCDRIGRLRGLAELARKLHYRGLERDELKRLLELLKDVIKGSTGRSNLSLLRRLEDFKVLADALPDTLYPFRPRDWVLKIKSMLSALPLLPRPGILLPTSQELASRLDEIDMLIEVFTDELYRHTRLLSELFNVIKPEAIPWIIRFLKKNPGYVRTTIGEPLCIWWLGRALSQQPRKEVWRNAKGPRKVMGKEVNAESVWIDRGQCVYAVAEVKLSMKWQELEHAVNQVIEAAKLFTDPRNLKQAGFHNIKAVCRPREIAVVTLYKLKELKEELRSKLEEKARSENIDAVTYVYDIDDILKNLRGFSGKERYRKLFEVVNRILETT